MKYYLLAVGFCFFLAGCNSSSVSEIRPLPAITGTSSLTFTGPSTTTWRAKEFWQSHLTPMRYHILWEAGTEPPFTGSWLHNNRKGTYVTAGCRIPVFRSETKFDSGTGWPSFFEAIPDSVVLRPDNSIPFEPRVEVLSRCGEHLGHVFDDGPPPTGKRYCMNSAAMDFVPDNT